MAAASTEALADTARDARLYALELLVRDAPGILLSPAELETLNQHERAITQSLRANDAPSGARPSPAPFVPWGPDEQQRFVHGVRLTGADSRSPRELWRQLAHGSGQPALAPSILRTARAILRTFPSASHISPQAAAQQSSSCTIGFYSCTAPSPWAAPRLYRKASLPHLRRPPPPLPPQPPLPPLLPLLRHRCQGRRAVPTARCRPCAASLAWQRYGPRGRRSLQLSTRRSRDRQRRRSSHRRSCRRRRSRRSSASSSSGCRRHRMPRPPMCGHRRLRRLCQLRLSQ